MRALPPQVAHAFSRSGRSRSDARSTGTSMRVSNSSLQLPQRYGA